MNKHYPNTDFEALRVPQLEKIYNGINHSVEELQEKMNRDMGRSLSKYDIHPRNYNIIPEIEKCSLHDLELLEELTEKRFRCYWTMEKKKAKENGTLEQYYATFKFYDFRNRMNDEQINELFVRAEAYCHQRMTTHKIIECIMQAPNFLEEVLA